jgi:acyl-CoA synthetase (AMP-forming)/AMP-acid ligase II
MGTRPAGMTEGGWSLAGIVRRHAAEHGTRPMLTHGDRIVTYGEMHARSSRVAQALAAEGVRSQDRVGFIDKNGPEYFEVLFGGGKLNAVNVAVNWRLAPAEMAYIVNDAQVGVLILGHEFTAHLEQMASSLRTVRKIVVLGEHPLYESYERWVGRQGAEDPGHAPAPDDVAMQLYTSGTTGLPKGAMLSNRNLGTLLPSVSRAWGFDDGAVSLVAMPLFHIGGSGWALVGMWNGCHSILFREFVPAEILAAIPRHRVTHALFVPAMLQVLAAIPGAADLDFTTLRAIVYGASPITDEVLRRAMRTFRCDFIPVYGLTETTGAITQLPPDDHDPGGPRARLLRSAGKPFPWVELRVVDPASGQDRAPGEVGELWTRSIQNFQGYWNRPDETARTVTADGWLRTGDAGYLDEDGYVFLTDRVKDMIITGGENVYPAEVENVLADHPAVADVAVIGVPDERWGETVKAVVVRAPGCEPSPEEIIAYARERLAHFKCPTSVDFVEALPRNPSGKLLKREIREPYWKGHERRIH